MTQITAARSVTVPDAVVAVPLSWSGQVAIQPHEDPLWNRAPLVASHHESE